MNYTIHVPRAPDRIHLTSPRGHVTREQAIAMHVAARWWLSAPEKVCRPYCRICQDAVRVMVEIRLNSTSRGASR